ncbi:hypothetical protein FOA52_012508 [Chlamydomonas sp. UWO 241]|nr:hypothetical protein FOA52_012508 [Chlamydomonas sp. UWO 241]
MAAATKPRADVFTNFPIKCQSCDTIVWRHLFLAHIKSQHGEPTSADMEHAISIDQWKNSRKRAGQAIDAIEDELEAIRKPISESGGIDGGLINMFYSKLM